MTLTNHAQDARNGTLDPLDLRLLALVQKDARLTHAELSERVPLSPSQCQRRLKRLEARGVIRGQVALLDRAVLGLGVMAFVSVSLEKHGPDPAEAFRRAIQRYPEILECWAVTGEADYMMRVVAPDLGTFSTFLMRELMALPTVASVRSTVLLEELKSTTALPLPTTEP